MFRTGFALKRMLRNTLQLQAVKLLTTHPQLCPPHPARIASQHHQSRQQTRRCLGRRRNICNSATLRHCIKPSTAPPDPSAKTMKRGTSTEVSTSAHLYPRNLFQLQRLSPAWITCCSPRLTWKSAPATVTVLAVTAPYQAEPSGTPPKGLPPTMTGKTKTQPKSPKRYADLILKMKWLRLLYWVWESKRGP